MKLCMTLGILSALLIVAPTSHAAEQYKQCRAVKDVFEGTRYEGSDLYRIRAKGVSCRTARRVARKGTYRAVGAVPDATGRVVVRYRRWTVIDDLRGAVDRFVAKSAGEKRVRWLFGDI